MRRIAYSFRFFGSKSYQIKEIIDKLEELNRKHEYDTFVEVFGGSGRLTLGIEDDVFNKKVYNDRDPAIVNLLNCLMDDDTRREMYHIFMRFPWSRHLFNDGKKLNTTYTKMYEDGKFEQLDDLGWAIATYYIHGYSFMGKASKMGYFIKSWRNIGKENIDVLKHFGDNHTKNVIIENMDYKDIIEKYDSPTTIFYFDPPYIRESSIYRYGFTVDDYYKLKSLLDGMQGKYIMNISMNDSVDVVDIFGKPKYVIEYHAHAYITDKERPDFGMGFWTNW